MKSKAKLQNTAVELSAKLRPMTAKQMSWAVDNCLENNAARSRKSLYCLECGHSWKDESFLISAVVGCTCPNCDRELKLKSARSESAYFSIITAKEGVQVVRMFWVQKNYYKKSPTYSWTSEVMQHFIFSSGKVVTLSKQVNGMSRYFDQWIHDSELKARSCDTDKAKMRYDIGAYKTYPVRSIIPELKRNGFVGQFHDFTPHKFFSLLLSVPAAETLIKARQIGMLRHLALHPKAVQESWKSIKICLRNGYMIKDAQTWLDYINLLARFEKDLTNAHYVCPIDLNAAHDKSMRKRQAVDRAKKLEQMKAEIETAQIEYEKEKRAFFGLQFSDSKITVKVLEHVQEFMHEGDTLKHCLFTNAYYKKCDSLVMSARIEDDPIETIELSLSTMKVLQSRGIGNKSTKYHNQILNLVNSNLHAISAVMST